MDIIYLTIKIALLIAVILTPLFNVRNTKITKDRELCQYGINDEGKPEKLDIKEMSHHVVD